ncbi:MAG TPA: hypothetical protein VJ882_05715 [Desulfuromonadales bacterium]|nr:hypothetical protein [Desulfuromonadales bacterium]
MKNTRHFYVLLAAIVLLVMAVGCENDSQVLQVNDIASDPAAFSGSLTMVGIAYGYSRNDDTIVGVMDKKELQCTTPNCEKLLIPVKIKGDRPAIGEEIKITGSFTREPQGYLFHAEKIKVLGKHQLGGQG